MKKLVCVLVATSGLMFYNCSSGKKSMSKTNVRPSKSSSVSMSSYDEPTYKVDRRLAETMTDSTDNTGALGSGTGASYASFSYRSRAYKLAKAKTSQRNSSLATYQSK